MILASCVSIILTVPAVVADSKFDVQIEKVRQLRRDRQFVKSIALLDQMLQEQPNNAIAYGDRGLDYLESAQYERAIRDLTMALKLDPTDIEPLGRRAFCYAQLHKYDDAIADYNRLIQLVPNDGMWYLDRAHAYEKMGNSQMAKLDKQHAAERGCSPGDQQAVDRIKQLYYVGKFKAANEQLSALERNGCRLIDLYSVRGRCRLMEEDFEYAASDFTRGLQIHPADLSLMVLRAQAYMNLEKYDAALADCNEVIKKQPMTRVVTPSGKPLKINVLFEAYRERVNAYRALGQFEKALDDCSASLREWPDKLETLEVRAGLEKRLKKPQLSAADYLRATRMDPKNADAWFGLAAAYADMKQYANAVRTCTTYLSAFPKDDDAYVLRADYYLCLGDSKKAIDDYSHAIALSPDNASPALRKRAAAYLKSGDKSRAQSDLKEAERLELDRPIAPSNMHQKPPAHSSVP